MSSHREAPGISKDPVADNTDLYAFVSPDNPSTVTLIANYIPLQLPAGGPNFYEFGDDVLYEIHIDNDADGDTNITYQFLFQTTLSNPNTFLYNTGPIGSLHDPHWNKRQLYSVTRSNNGVVDHLGTSFTCPPCNIGPFSTPNYAALASAAVHPLATGETVFAGQRAEGSYIDSGSVFDLLNLRPFQNLHASSAFTAAPGVNGTNQLNVHTIAVQVPKTLLTSDGSNPTDPSDPRSVIGVYASAKRRQALILGPTVAESGPWVQVSRLGNPFVNALLISLKNKDLWNSELPGKDSQFLDFVQHPEVAKRLPPSYPGVFPNLAAYTKARADLVKLLLTGFSAGIIPGFQNYTGTTQADLLRLNMAIHPSTTPNILGVLGGDLSGFPNGRRVFDDVFSVVLRALAGLTIPLVDPTFKPDAAAGSLTDGLTPSSVSAPYLTGFPYLGLPYDGYDYPSA